MRVCLNHMLSIMLHVDLWLLLVLHVHFKLDGKFAFLWQIGRPSFEMSWVFISVLCMPVSVSLFMYICMYACLYVERRYFFVHG